MKKGNVSSSSFNHVKVAAQHHRDEILEKISSIIRSGIFLNGEENKMWEKNLATFLGGGHVVSVASGHDALSLALSFLHLSSHDEVIFPVNAYPTAFPAALSGARMVPADVDENGQLDLRELEKKVNKRTKAIILVHLYGLVGDIEGIHDLAKRNKSILIEDCAQSFGSSYKHKLVGTFGDIACFSFYPTKNLGTFGDGGALWTRHKHMREYFIKARSYGERKKYESLFPSGHSRLPEIQAGILNIFFKHIGIDFKKRAQVANYYKKRLQGSKLSERIRVLESHPQSNSVQHLFVVEMQKRDALRSYLSDKDIPTSIHYSYPVHLVPAFSFLGYKKGDFPVAERLSKNMVSLPFSPFLSEREVDSIVDTIQGFYHD